VRGPASKAGRIGSLWRNFSDRRAFVRHTKRPSGAQPGRGCLRTSDGDPRKRVPVLT
jgi:hypothetical protein